jgi:hypothetical protein
MTMSTTPAAETATTTAPADDSALVADLESLLASEPAAAAPAPAQATPAPAPQDAEAIPPDLEAQLVAQAKGRQAERAAREPVEQMRTELAALRAELERAPGLTAIAAAVQAKDPAALASALRAANVDPDAVQQLATRAKLAPPQADVMASAIKQAVSEALAAAGVRPQSQRQQAAADPSETLGAFVAYIGGAPERFPLQAAMGEYAGPAVVRFIQERLLKNGVTPDEVDALPPEKVAAMFEAHLAQSRPRLSQPSGAQPASGEPVSQPPGASSASGGPRSSATPTALTNGHAADTTRALPRTPREIDAELTREIDAMKKAAGL